MSVSCAGVFASLLSVMRVVDGVGKGLCGELADEVGVSLIKKAKKFGFFFL